MSHGPKRRNRHSPEAFSRIGRGRVRSGRLRPFVWILVGLAILVWSLLAWLLYSFTDPVLAWLATSLELVVNQGQDAARTLGGAPAGDVLAALDTSRWAGQLLGMVKGAGKAAVVVVWLIGLLILAILPLGLSLIGRFYVRGRR